MSGAIFNTKDIAEVSAKTIDFLKNQAQSSQFGRFRFCLHHSSEELVNEMVIVLYNSSYVRPHRHPPGKSESYHLIEGDMTVFLFDDDGKVIHCIDMGPLESGKTFLYHLSNNIWHMPVPRSETVVFHEVYTGPFDREHDVEYAVWSPSEEDDIEAINRFLASVETAEVEYSEG